MANDDILVVVFLRGGCDGLNLVGPSADAIYRTERRPEARVERDGDNPGLVLPNSFADSDFRFHYKATALKELYDASHLAVIHACGLTNGTRSHFEAQDFIERGTPENKNTPSGWLARLAAAQRMEGSTSVIAVGNGTPASLLACPNAIAVPRVNRVQLSGDAHFHAARLAVLQQAYQGNSAVQQNGRRGLEVLQVFGQHQPLDAHGKPTDYIPAGNAQYAADGPGTELSNSFKTLAQILKMDIGARVATIDYGGWDTHVGQAGRFAGLTDGLSRSLMAFWNDMAGMQDRITVVVMSEFGRRLRSNDSGGTDHGHGNAMLVLGGHIKGGNIYGTWPGLATEQLDNQVDLAVTTDYRDILGEIIQRRFNTTPGAVFPGFSNYKPLGFIA